MPAGLEARDQRVLWSFWGSSFGHGGRRDSPREMPWRWIRFGGHIFFRSVIDCFLSLHPPPPPPPMDDHIRYDRR